MKLKNKTPIMEKTDMETQQLEPTKKIESTVENASVGEEATKEEEKKLPFEDKGLEKIIDDALKEVECLENKEYEEMQKPATKEDIYELKELISKVKEQVNDVDIHVNNRNAEYINYLKLIFDRLKFIKGRIGKWFLISSIILVVGGGVTFTTIFYHWDNLEPKIDKILGVAKVASNVAKIGGN